VTVWPMRQALAGAAFAQGVTKVGEQQMVNPYYSSARSLTTGESERESARRVNIGIMVEKPRMTVFGAVVGELMLERDIRSWTDLSKLLKARGHNFEGSRLSGWAYGQHDVDWRFVRAPIRPARIPNAPSASSSHVRVPLPALSPATMAKTPSTTA
jgi:hypothetical protein